MSKNFFASQGITITLKNLRQLISAFPQTAGSVTVMSQPRMLAQLQLWKTELPSVKPLYAVKCNPEPILLETLYKQGVGFDCASLRETTEVAKCGSMIDMIYAHPMKSERDIGIIDANGIRTTVVDSLEECDKLTKCGWRGSAYLRVAVEDAGSKMPFSVKFGASEKEVELISKHSKVPLSGVSFHVGSGCDDPSQYETAIKYVDDYVFNTLRKYGHNPKTIDIGGGFSSNETEFKPAARAIRKAMDALPKNRTFIAEPGRFFAQPSQDLFVKVIAKKPGRNGKGWRYVVDESLYGHFSCIPFDHQTPAWYRVPIDDSVRECKESDSILFGRTCDSLDVIARGTMEELEVGDWLYFPLMGAYTSATASEFNGFPKPHIILDTENALPSADVAWLMTEFFHKKTPLKYSNTLVPIT